MEFLERGICLTVLQKREGKIVVGAGIGRGQLHHAHEVLCGFLRQPRALQQQAEASVAFDRIRLTLDELLKGVNCSSNIALLLQP